MAGRPTMIALSVVLLAWFAAPVTAAPPVNEDQPFKAVGALSDDSIAPGETTEIRVTIHVLAEHYIYLKDTSVEVTDGGGLEVAAARLQIPLDELAATALGAPGEVPISSTCTVFAESEMVSLLARGETVENITRGLIRSLVSRVASLAKSVQPKPPIMLSGGVARSEAVRCFLGEAMGHEVQLPEEPQLMGASGAALIAIK